jgi:hypothetical protein
VRLKVDANCLHSDRCEHQRDASEPGGVCLLKGRKRSNWTFYSWSCLIGWIGA